MYIRHVLRVCAESSRQKEVIMGGLKAKLGFNPQTVEIQSNFIEFYMAGCPAIYPLVYIYTLKKITIGEAISNLDLASYFNVTESDVIAAWKHWQSMGVVDVEENGKDMAITFLTVPIPELKPLPAKIPPTPAANARPQYTVDELTVYRKQSRDIARLFERAEQALGKLLYYNDMNIIFSFHDWLRLPIDVIEYLLTFCANSGHRNLRYIEKCAIDWADNDVFDMEKALNYVQKFDKKYRTILSYMGQVTSYPTPSHRKYMDKWLDEWQMPLDLIMEACDRSVAQIEKPKFNYVDKILAEWFKQGIKDIEGVKLADANHAANKKQSEQKIELPRAKQNRFVNFNQRETDYSRYEELERAYLEQRLK